MALWHADIDVSYVDDSFMALFKHGGTVTESHSIWVLLYEDGVAAGGSVLTRRGLNNLSMAERMTGVLKLELMSR